MLSCHHSHFIKYDHLICKLVYPVWHLCNKTECIRKNWFWSICICNSILLTDICHWSFCCDLVVQRSFYSSSQQKTLNVEMSNCKESFLLPFIISPKCRNSVQYLLSSSWNFWCIFYFQAQDQKYLTYWKGGKRQIISFSLYNKIWTSISITECCWKL